MILPDRTAVSDFAGPFQKGSFEIVPLQKDLSKRTYFALVSSSHPRLILCIHQDPQDSAIGDFGSIGAFLAAGGIRVPSLLAVDRSRGWTLQSDAGSRDAGSLTGSASLAPLYDALIDIIVRMQGLQAKGPVSERSFDAVKLKLEISFFQEQFALAGKPLGLSDIPFEFNMFLLSVCEKLGEPGDWVFVHRDLHSRNVMLNDQDEPVLIDFQDARMGLPWYDLASLVYDPYLDLGREERERLVRRYLEKSRRGPGRNLLYLQALQRTVKAIGTYLSVLASSRSPFYLDALKQAFAYLEEIVQLGGFPDHGFVFANEGRIALGKLAW